MEIERCPRCGAEARIVGFVTEPAGAGRILAHLARRGIEARAAATRAVPVRRTRDPREAVSRADVVYTDTWTRIGQEKDAEWRRVIFAGFQVNEELMSAAKPDALFMHCLPTHRGEAVTDAVMDGSQSIVIEQAENRLHLKKGLMTELAHGNDTRGRAPRSRQAVAATK